MLRVVLILAMFWLSTQPIHAVEFNIENPLIDGLSISVDASLSATTNYYFQGTLRSVGSSKYFGETKNNRGDWVDYISSPEKEFIVSNFLVSEVQSASWSGQIAIRYKVDDPNYFGPGNYELKIKRFTGNSTGSAGESNTLVITLTAPLPAPSPTPTPTPTPTPSPSPTLIPSPSPSLSPSLVPTHKPSPSPSPDLAPLSEGTIAGEIIDLSAFTNPTPSLSPSASPKTSQTGFALRKDRLKNLLMIGGGLLLVSVSSFFAYRKYLDQGKIGE